MWIGQTGGYDYRKVYADNQTDIDAFAKDNNFDVTKLSSAERKKLVKSWIDETGFVPQKPNWFKRIISNVRLWFHNHGFKVKHFTDDDIANIILRSAKAARDQRRSMEGKRTGTDKSDYSDKSDGNGTRFMTEGNIKEIKKLDYSQYQENTMLSGNEDIVLIDIPRIYKTVAAAEKEIAEKIRQANGHLIVVNEDQNMDILIQNNGSLDEAVSEKAVKETFSDGTSAEIHAAALANIEQLLTKARLGASHRDWHTYAKNQQRGTNKETALQIHRFYTAMQYGDDIYGVKNDSTGKKERINCLLHTRSS